MIRDIFLHGLAGRRFGRHFRLDVSSPREAARALVVLRPGLRALLREGLWRVIVGKPHLRNGVNVDALDMQLGRQPLHLVPVTRPRGSGSDASIGKIIVGVVIIGAAILLSPFTAGASIGFAAAMATEVTVGGAAIGVTFGTIALLGVSMLAAGVAGLLTSQSALKQADPNTQSPLDAPSFLFNGVRNNTTPGGPVPLVYGTFLTGTVLVGAALQVTDIPIS